MLYYLDRVVFKLRSVPRQLPTLRGWTNDEIKCRARQESITRFGRGYLVDTLNNITITDEQALFRDGRAAIDLIMTSSRRLVEVIIELEEFIPGACGPLKRVRKVVAESVSDALIGDMPKASKSRTPVLSQDSYKSEGFLMQIDAIEKQFMGSREKVHDFPQLAIPSFILRVSQKEKEALPEGVVVVDS